MKEWHAIIFVIHLRSILFGVFVFLVLFFFFQSFILFLDHLISIVDHKMWLFAYSLRLLLHVLLLFLPSLSFYFMSFVWFLWIKNIWHFISISWISNHVINLLYIFFCFYDSRIIQSMYRVLQKICQFVKHLLVVLKLQFSSSNFNSRFHWRLFSSTLFGLYFCLLWLFMSFFLF